MAIDRTAGQGGAMRNLVAWAAFAAVVVAGCKGSHARWEHDRAANARKLEVQVDGGGHYAEVEYHISPDSVPAAVRKAMDQLHPGGAFEDAEYETSKGKPYYELARKVNGMEVEAMFTPAGVLHSEEIQIPGSKVPEAVRSRATSWGGQVTMWEEIRDEKREVTGYHAKVTRGADKFKLMFEPGGALEGAVREVPAEIEVPVK
jgi:hypothetical protein